MAEIVLDHVSKRFPDGTFGVNDANLQIGDGEFVILVGPSGSGKSTCLNMIAGLEDVTEGELRIGGRVVNQLAPKERDMAFALKLAKVDREEIERKVNQAAEMLELTALLDRKPANLSGGQRQRVAMGRAIVRSPQAFLMDEPLSNLDAKLRVQMRTTVSRLQNQLGTTMVYVTHDQTEAMTLGDRIAVMRSGVIQQVGTGPDLIMGIRPEHFKDTVLGRDRKVPSTSFRAVVDVLEWLGAEEYAYFHVQGSRDSASRAREGEPMELWFDTSKIHLFNPENGAHLTL